jgi:hypothetical protein
METRLECLDHEVAKRRMRRVTEVITGLCLVAVLAQHLGVL